MQTTIYFVLEYCPLIPLLYGLPKYALLGKPLKYFLLYLALSTLFTGVMTILAFKGPNLWMLNLTMLIYVTIILWIFSLWQRPHSKLQILLRGLVLFFYIVWLIEIVGQGRISQFTAYTRPLEGILFIFAACLTIYQANRDLDLPILDKPQFWISSGMLLYYGGVIIVNLVSDHLLHVSMDRLKDVFLIPAVMNVIAHLFFTGAFMCSPRGLAYGETEQTIQKT
jgi:hypothetical protein